LIEYKTKSVNTEVEKLKNDLSKINVELIKLEDKGNKKYVSQLDDLIKQKKSELKSHKQLKPKVVVDPNKNKVLENKKNEELAKADKLSQYIK
jgi:hypothetical protein